MDSQVLRNKIAFFAELDTLNNPINEEDDRFSKEEEDFRARTRAIFSLRGKDNQAPPRPPVQALTTRNLTLPPPKRSFSAPTPVAGTSKSPIIIEATPEPRADIRQLPVPPSSFVEETPLAQPPHPLLRSSASMVAERSPSVASGMRKRKRQRETVDTVPESEQILRGVAFYYIPNDDVAPARKLRIRNAQTYGGRWVRELANANHVIVDNRLSYKDIEKIFVSGGSGLVITNEDYPIDCIAHHSLLNPSQTRYRVSGIPVAEDKPAAGSSAVQYGSSGPSLPLKEPPVDPRRWDQVPRRGTPSRSGESFAQRVKVSQTQTPPEGPPNNRNNLVDALQHSRSHSSSPWVEDSMTRSENQAPSGRHIHDELSEYIKLMLKYKDLPLDAEEEEEEAQSTKGSESISTSEADSGSEDDRARKTRPPKRNNKKDVAFEDRFACNRGGTLTKTADNPNPNARTIEVLQLMCDYYTRIDDQWRTLAYRKAINTLRQQTTKIATAEEAFLLPNIGDRLAAKIEEIVTTNALRRLEYAQDEPADHALSTFLGIYGVGTAVAKRWLAQGYRTLDDLRARADLTPNQRLGIDHFDDLNTRIPRTEVAALGAYVTREAILIDPAVELLIGGSYRRGSASSGDIDFIVTKKGTVEISNDLVTFLEELIRTLTAKGFLVATLAALHSTRRPRKDGPGSKWHGCCVLPPSEHARLGITREKPIWRRIDFLLVPESQYGAALIYFTGNDIFNRSMRLLASKKKMRLNQRGLYKEAMRGGKSRAKITEGELVEGRDERRIFELLGVKWREPYERWC